MLFLFLYYPKIDKNIKCSCCSCKDIHYNILQWNTKNKSKAKNIFVTQFVLQIHNSWIFQLSHTATNFYLDENKADIT